MHNLCKMFVYSRTLPVIKFNCMILRSFYRKRDYKEVFIKVPWGHVSGKWWEPFDVRPVLCLHGWQDNCGTYDRLIPMLNTNVGFLAIDFPGHGHSSRLPEGLAYNYKQYLLTVRAIKNTFKWPKITLMGHSLGGVIAYIFAMFYIKEVDFIICIDGVKPLVAGAKVNRLASNLAKFLKYHEHSLETAEPPLYTLVELVEKICKPNGNSIMPAYAKFILERNIAPSKLQKGKFYFTRDPRLKTIDVFDFCQDDLVEWAQIMTIPIFIAKSKGASYYEPKRNFDGVLEVLKKSSIDCSFHFIEGTHHVHLNNPQDVAPLMIAFITKHDSGDRTFGGLMDDIVVDKKDPVVLDNN